MVTKEKNNSMLCFGWIQPVAFRLCGVQGLGTRGTCMSATESRAALGSPASAAAVLWLPLAHWLPSGCGP